MKYGEIAIKDSELERWENPFPENNYLIEIVFPEFTSLCPRSGYPDFGTIKINYIPNEYIVELKSLKLYLNSFRNKYKSHEDSINTISKDLKSLLSPRFIEITGDFNIRGGIKTTIRMSSDGNHESDNG